MRFEDLIGAGVLEIGDGYRAKNEELTGGGVIFLRAGHVQDDWIDFDGVEKLDVGLTPKLGPKLSKAGDVIVTTKGNSTGRTSFVTAIMPPFVYSPHLSFWRSHDWEKLHPRFLRYWSRGREFETQLRGMAASTDMAPYLSLGDQRRLRITLPHPTEQRRIAEILGALDDKIELNRRMNETLEAIARTTFKKWFVRGEEVGPIRTWGDLITLEYGKSLADYGADGVVPVYGTNGMIGRTTRALCLHDGIVVGRKGAYRGIHYSGEPFFVIDTAFYVEPKVPLEMRWAYYEMLSLDIDSMDSGSAIPSTSREDFYALQVRFPPVELQSRFAKILEPFWERQRANEAECHTLAQLRDTLLPKLLSGELRVGTAEKELAGHV